MEILHLLLQATIEEKHKINGVSFQKTLLMLANGNPEAVLFKGMQHFFG